MARPKSEDKREALLQAAMKVFAEAGVSAPALSISSAAGVSEGSFFTYFKTKDELINVLFREIQLGLADVVMTGFPRRESVRQRMEHVWSGYVAWGVENPVARQALKQLHLATALSDESRAIGQGHFVEVERMRQDAIAQRIVRDLPPEVVHGTLKALAEMTMDLIASKPREATRYRNLGFEMFWTALTKKP
jgi:AcrR family transcriptional regulator